MNWAYIPPLFFKFLWYSEIKDLVATDEFLQILSEAYVAAKTPTNYFDMTNGKLMFKKVAVGLLTNISLSSMFRIPPFPSSFSVGIFIC
jgi:hypothetical protein